nr:Cysteine synthase A [Streptomyces sp. F8]
MDIPITARQAARIAVARNAGINMNPVRECTNADRAAWASEALEAYNQHAPTTLLPVPERTERVRLGVLAAEAMAQVAFNHPGDQVVDDQESADRVIGDLVAQLFCLTDGRTGQLPGPLPGRRGAAQRGVPRPPHRCVRRRRRRSGARGGDARGALGRGPVVRVRRPRLGRQRPRLLRRPQGRGSRFGEQLSRRRSPN